MAPDAGQDVLEGMGLEMVLVTDLGAGPFPQSEEEINESMHWPL